MKRTIAFTVLSAALAAALAGCGAGTVHSGDATLPASEESPGFIDRMSDGTRVSENDAMRGVLMLLSDTDDAKTFAQRVERLKGKGIVPSTRWDFQADRPITRGKLAYMIYQACDVPGGVTLALAGPSQRYCLRELQYRGFMTPGSWHVAVTGSEYVAVLNRADTYRREGKLPPLLQTASQ